MNYVRPTLLAWSERYDHLREITRDDVKAALDDLHGARRSHQPLSHDPSPLGCRKRGGHWPPFRG
ncbi:hypothetical protein AB0F17_59940 [Nonomuraea sp. NPDC026600]|uniref:hypothetical protein n=1 Tax=Nonomuraea sp. NPDC026600 TaxID=3155363 RepID=UPI0033C6E26B